MTIENERETIRNLQRYLRTLSYFDERIGRVPIDGTYDNATREAVSAFQAAYGLPVTGRVDARTWALLFESYQKERALRDAPARISHFPRLPENYTVELGEQQFLVQIIQHALSELDTVYGWGFGIPLSGIYDEPTAAAVRIFQQRNALPATGGVDRATWNALANAYNAQFADYVRE